jgi:hypothetical protein
LGILLISMEPKLKQDVVAPPQKSNIHEYSHVLATVIYVFLSWGADTHSQIAHKMLVQTHAMQVSGVWLRLNQETLGIMAKSDKSRI